MDKSSILDATATGYDIGPGSVVTSSGSVNGGSYAGQGGAEDDAREPSTYGDYYSIIDTTKDLTNFLGSGGAKNRNQRDVSTRGGGAIYLKAKLF